MIRPILVWPDPALRQVSRTIDVGRPDPVLGPLVLDLLDTMYGSGAVGLAAIQVGVPLTVFVMDVGGTPVGERVYINPGIISHVGVKTLMGEGCMSVPGVYEQVERYPAVTVGGWDATCRPFLRTLRGLAAQCVQHELEHFDGVLLPDKFSPERQAMMRLKVKHRQKRRNRP